MNSPENENFPREFKGDFEMMKSFKDAFERFLIDFQIKIFDRALLRNVNSLASYCDRTLEAVSII